MAEAHAHAGREVAEAEDEGLEASKGVARRSNEPCSATQSSRLTCKPVLAYT